MNFALRCFVVLPLILSLASACSSVEVETVLDEDWAKVTEHSYSWLSTSDELLSQSALEAAEPTLDERWRAAIDAGFAKAGWRKVERSSAALLLEMETRVSVRSRTSDPYFATTTGEKLEEGSLTLRLVEPKQGALIWMGTGSSVLRRVARQIGLLSKSWEETDAPREWPVEKMVRAVLNKLPASAKEPAKPQESAEPVESAEPR